MWVLTLTFHRVTSKSELVGRMKNSNILLRIRNRFIWLSWNCWHRKVLGHWTAHGGQDMLIIHRLPSLVSSLTSEAHHWIRKMEFSAGCRTLCGSNFNSSLWHFFIHKYNNILTNIYTLCPSSRLQLRHLKLIVFSVCINFNPDEGHTIVVELLVYLWKIRPGDSCHINVTSLSFAETMHTTQEEYRYVYAKIETTHS